MWGVMKGGIAPPPSIQTPTPTEGEKEVKMKEQGSGGKSNDGFRRQKNLKREANCVPRWFKVAIDFYLGSERGLPKLWDIIHRSMLIQMFH